MSQINAIIIDDEAASRENLILLLNRFTPQVNILGDFKNLKDGVAFLKANKIDLVFLDVEMPDYAGYEISSFFDEIPFEIIFITAYDKYAIKAFELAAIDYLLKPIEIDRLKESISRFENKYNIENTKERLKKIENQVEASREATIFIHHDGYKKPIQVTNIIALEGQSAYTKIYTKDEQHYIVSKNIAEMEKELDKYNHFYRSHKSWIINLKEINFFSKSRYLVKLNNCLEAKISRKKLKEFLQIVE